MLTAQELRDFAKNNQERRHQSDLKAGFQRRQLALQRVKQEIPKMEVVLKEEALKGYNHHSFEIGFDAHEEAAALAEHFASYGYQADVHVGYSNKFFLKLEW